MAPIMLGQTLGFNLGDVSAVDWSAENLGQASGYLMLFGWIGLLLVMVGYRLFDKCVPSEAQQRIVEPEDKVAGG